MPTGSANKKWIHHVDKKWVRHAVGKWVRRGDEKWLRRQRNVDLQDALRSRGLNTVGRKGELVSRLLSSVQS